tara:strand:- start:6343 stop:9162 length:2820 start_codon:yes stop_codon:yes gene_type:complete
MNTKLVSEWNVANSKPGFKLDFDKVCDKFIAEDISIFLDKKTDKKGGLFFDLLTSEYQKVINLIGSKRWVKLIDEIYFDKRANGCWLLQDLRPLCNEGQKNEDNLHSNFNSNTPLPEVEEFINKKLNDPFNQWKIPSLRQLRFITQLPGVTNSYFQTSKGRFFRFDYTLYAKADTVQAFDCDEGQLRDAATGVSIPFLEFSNTDLTEKALFIEFLKKGLTPYSLGDSVGYSTLLTIFHVEVKDSFINQVEAGEELLQKQYNLIVNDYVVDSLLNEDKIRADIAPYHHKMLQDTDQGHWSLWPSDKVDDKNNIIPLAENLVARDPTSSINDGVVAIDFGTRSTVVVYQKDNVNIHPMRIGTGDLSKAVAAFHYENPTIMEFNDLDKFINSYNEKPNKPFTRWQDVTISHTAQNAMHGAESSQFNTFLDEIKQWAGDKNRKLKIVGKQGKVIDLPPFLDIAEGDFNPIEIYAYYLGLYINNQNNGIYLDYILSFPVTYEMPIRDKIIESFEKGLQKSLPPELGEEALSRLTVTKGASEPAAYALVALQAFDFDPCDDERIFYSVFDFGGGTTDFDFGIFREANGKKERRFDYVIEHFGAGGDKFLGGENLLELLAFEIFKKNKEILLSKGIQFEKHPEKDSFAGSEQLFNSSQEAKINTKTLCETLRPFWEGDADSSIDLSQGAISINLTDVNAVVHTAFELDVDEDELNTILYQRIERGVINFFNALRLAFSNSKISLQDINGIEIFLAGNSSKSHFVKDIFEKQIFIQHEQMESSQIDGCFKLYPPLGADSEDVEKPTGKTGVAFGLIESREGGRIKVVDHNVEADDIRFKFYIGENRKNKFKTIIDREIPFNKWIEFIDAGYEKFEFFYTDQPSASTGDMSVADSAVKKSAVKLDMKDDEAMVYMRVVSPTKIEYVVANESGIENDTYLNEIQSIELT